MPINYVAPGPLQQIMSNSHSSGGGGGGITYGPDRTSQFQNELALAGLQGSIHAGIEREQIAGQLNQQQAHAESQAWLFNQEMTLKDQARLQQMKQAVSAVTADPTLTAEEKQRGITMLRSGIDPMDMRLKKQQMEALAQQRQAEAAKFQAQKERMDIVNALQSGEVDGQIDQYILPQYKQMMSDHMAKMFPDLKPGTPDYQGKMKMEATEMGAAIDMLKVPNKGLVPLSTAKAMLGGTMGEADGPNKSAKIEQGPDQQKMYEHALDRAQKLLTKKSITGETINPTYAEVKALADTIRTDNTSFHGQQKEAKTHEQAYQSALGGVQTKIQNIQNSDMNRGVKEFMVSKLNEVQELTKQYPPGGKLKMPKSVEARVNKLLDSIEQYNIPTAAAGG